MIPKKIFLHSIGYLRSIAIFAVVAIHATSVTFEEANYDVHRDPVSIFINQMFRFAVPLFFALSGFSLELNFDRHINTIAFIRKRLLKIFIPYVFWSALYFYFIFPNDSESFLRSLIEGNASYQLYFIPSLFIFYLFFPLLHRIYGFLTNKWFLIISAALEFYLLYNDYFKGGLKLFLPLKVFLLNYLIFILGMVAAQNRERLEQIIHKNRLLITIGAVMTGLYVFLEGSGLIKYKNISDIYSQWRPSVFIYSILFGLSMYYICERISYKNKLLINISKVSLFIYFVHIAVLYFVWKKIGFMFNIWGFDFILVISVFTISYIAGFIIKKIPYLSVLTG